MTKTKVSKRSPKNGTAVVKVKATLPVKAAEGVRAITAVDPQALLTQAIDKGMPVESMERLLAMRREMKAEWARDQFFEALSGFQSVCPVVEKNHKVPEKDKATKKIVGTRYSYAAIEDLVFQAGPFLKEYGFSWTVKPEQTVNDVTAVVHLHHKSGHEEITKFTVPIDPAAYMSDPQKAAAALTFATRYAFKGATGIQTKGEDNDAQQDDEPRQSRAPIRQPQELSLKEGFEILGHGDKKNAVPVAHEVKLSDYDKILKYTKATVYEPKTKKTIAVFTENEQIDYTHEANEAKDNPEELKRIGAEMVETWKKREKAIKGETA